MLPLIADAGCTSSGAAQHVADYLSQFRWEHIWLREVPTNGDFPALHLFSLLRCVFKCRIRVVGDGRLTVSERNTLGNKRILLILREHFLRVCHVIWLADTFSIASWVPRSHGSSEDKDFVSTCVAAPK